MYRELEHGLWPPADRAAAESDVAGLGSEAMATLCVEWLKPLLQHSDSDESCPAKTCRSVRRPGQAHTDGSAGLLPCQPGRHMYGAAAELQLCPSRHAGLEPALMKVRFMQPMTFWTNPAELRLLVWVAA